VICGGCAVHVGIATAPALYRKLPYDAIIDLEPIGRVADVPMTLVVPHRCDADPTPARG
jgi:tripartite-type tricarboxylate transporter receptor subunit TctC